MNTLKKGPIVAIDGPAGSGKTSVTRKVAEIFGFVHVDTGALYRSVSFLALEQKIIDRNNFSASTVNNNAEKLTELTRSAHIEFKYDPANRNHNRVYANGMDVTEEIRIPVVSTAASLVSAVPGVRAALLGIQRKLGGVGNTVLEGRDIGTVIFPDADVKVFLTANEDVRAKRRLAELDQSKTGPISLSEVKDQIVKRDQGDSQRAVAPLKKASDAIEIDTSSLSFDEVVRSVERLIREKTGKRN